MVNYGKFYAMYMERIFGLWLWWYLLLMQICWSSSTSICYIIALILTVFLNLFVTVSAQTAAQGLGWHDPATASPSVLWGLRCWCQPAHQRTIGGHPDGHSLRSEHHPDQFFHDWHEGGPLWRQPTAAQHSGGQRWHWPATQWVHVWGQHVPECRGLWCLFGQQHRQVPGGPRQPAQRQAGGIWCCTGYDRQRSCWTATFWWVDAHLFLLCIKTFGNIWPAFSLAGSGVFVRGVVVAVNFVKTSIIGIYSLTGEPHNTCRWVFFYGFFVFV